MFSKELLCSNCQNSIKEGEEKCHSCNSLINEKEPTAFIVGVQYQKEKERFIDVIYERKTREYLKEKYGEKEFDSRSGFIDWDFLNLFELADEELKYLSTAKYILSEDATETVLSKYDLQKEYSFEKKVEKIAENLNRKIETGDILQPFPEVGIGFSIVAEVYNRFFYFKNRVFEKDEEENLARNILRALVNFYSTILQNPYVKDEENIIERKLILLSTILFKITFCINLGDSLSNQQYYECENIINERLMRSALLYNFYKKKKKQGEKETQIRGLCREILNDLKKALFLQWEVKEKNMRPIFEIYGKKLLEFAGEGIDLPYFEMIESFLSRIHYMYEGEEVKDIITFLIKIVDMLNKLEEKKDERRERIGAYIRAYDFYRNNRELISLEMMKDEKIIHVILELFEKYYEIDSKIEKKEGIKREIEELSHYFTDEKKRDSLLSLLNEKK
ncbi:MAG: hypothetical protein HGN29_00485 [Asgard group archaeon]|nr:hypothetical protein [Asgard group archaeon]